MDRQLCCNTTGIQSLSPEDRVGQQAAAVDWDSMEVQAAPDIGAAEGEGVQHLAGTSEPVAPVVQG